MALPQRPSGRFRLATETSSTCPLPPVFLARAKGCCDAADRQGTRPRSPSGAHWRPSLTGCAGEPPEASPEPSVRLFSAGFPGLTWTMRPPIPSVSPLPSFCTRPDVVQRYEPFAEIVSSLWKHWRGIPKSQREKQVEDAVVTRLAVELEQAPNRTGWGEVDRWGDCASLSHPGRPNSYANVSRFSTTF